MKKFKKFAALALTFCMAASMFAGCDDSSSKKKNKKDRDEEEIEETEDEEETTETEETEETTTEETTTEETTEETTVEETEAEFVLPDGYDNIDAYVFEKYQETIEEINAVDSKALYAFDDSWGSDSWTSLFVQLSESSEVDEYNCVNGELTYIGTSDYVKPTYTYDEIKKFPALVKCNGIEFADKVANGTYYGSILAFALDGTQALVAVGDPIILSESEYNALKPGDTVYSDDEFELIVSDDYNSELGFGMFDDDCWFTKMDDGNYILETSSDYIIHVNNHLTFVNFADNCNIEDHFVWLYGEHGHDFNSTNFLDTMYYDSFVSDDYAGSFNYNMNGWSTAYGILEPVTIQNNTITDVVLGWR